MSNVEVIKSLYKAFAEGDLDSVSALLEPSVDFHLCKFYSRKHQNNGKTSKG